MSDTAHFRQIYSARSNKWAVPVVGVLASLAVHVLLFGPALFGLAIDRKHSSNASAPGESTMTLVFIEEESSDVRSHDDTDYSASLVLSSDGLARVALPNSPPPTTLAIEETAGEADASRLDNNEPGRAALLERYMGQIDARIQRAWVRPRTPVDSGLFVCRVRIAQERDGRVQEIELARCNGDIPWQTSLVHAIQSASPLPAPPDPKVFTQTLTFEFTARPFIPGGDMEGFEPGTQVAR